METDTWLCTTDQFGSPIFDNSMASILAPVIGNATRVSPYTGIGTFGTARIGAPPRTRSEVCFSGGDATGRGERPRGRLVLEPEQVADAFYRWYIGQIAHDHEPLLDNHVMLRKYVTAPVIARIVRQMNSANGLDADYFLQAQDIQDSWSSQVKAERTGEAQLLADVVVTLGESGSHYVLEVQLRKEAGVWKISRVRRPLPGAPLRQR